MSSSSLIFKSSINMLKSTFIFSDKDVIEPNPPYYDSLNSWVIKIYQYLIHFYIIIIISNLEFLK